MKEYRRARIRVTFDSLANALGLPEGTEIIAFVEDSELACVCELVVEHPDLEPVQQGQDVPAYNPWWERSTEERIKFADWNKE